MTDEDNAKPECPSGSPYLTRSESISIGRDVHRDLRHRDCSLGEAPRGVCCELLRALSPLATAASQPCSMSMSPPARRASRLTGWPSPKFYRIYFKICEDFGEICGRAPDFHQDLSNLRCWSWGSGLGPVGFGFGFGFGFGLGLARVRVRVRVGLGLKIVLLCLYMPALQGSALRSGPSADE